jgi:hypothetical protein
MGEDIPTLRWFFDGTQVVSYGHRTGDENRLPFNVEYDGDIGLVKIISVQSSITSDVINVTSTLTTNTSILESFSDIQCGTKAVRSDLVMVNISILGKSPVMSSVEEPPVMQLLIACRLMVNIEGYGGLGLLHSPAVENAIATPWCCLSIFIGA